MDTVPPFDSPLENPVGQPITGEWVTLNTPDGPMEAWLTRPNAATSEGDEPLLSPAVIVFMEIFGVNDHIRDICHHLSHEGYVALAINYYHRTTPNLNLSYDERGISIGRQHKADCTTAGLRMDAQAAINYLRMQPWVKPDAIGTIGFCFGGYVAYLVATLPAIRATASFYGAGVGDVANPEAPVHQTAQIAGRMLCFFGAQDSSIPPQQVTAVQYALAAQNQPDSVWVYPEAGHGFFCHARADYRPAEAADAWQRVLHLFKDCLT